MSLKNFIKNIDYKEFIREGAYSNIFLVSVGSKDYILKKIPNNQYRNIEYEIANQNKYYPNLNYCFAKNHDKEFSYLLFPYFPQGDLFDYLIKDCPINEQDVKIYIKNILKSINTLNNLGYSHLDIKLENFLVDDEFLVLTDFGSSHSIKNKNKIYTLYQEVGTNMYISPEINNGYYHINSDMWSVGVCMHNMLAGGILYKKVDDFLIDKKIINYFSDEANDLLNKFLIINPSERIYIKDAINHEWFKK